MTEKQQAAIYGTKAATLIEYGCDHFRPALKYAANAKNLDPSIAEWHFLTGQIMGNLLNLILYKDLSSLIL